MEPKFSELLDNYMYCWEEVAKGNATRHNRECLNTAREDIDEAFEALRTKDEV